jgi:hypothetical protein
LWHSAATPDCLSKKPGTENWVVVQFESLYELSFRSAALSREESAVSPSKTDSSPVKLASE